MFSYTASASGPKARGKRWVVIEVTSSPRKEIVNFFESTFYRLEYVFVVTFQALGSCLVINV